MSEWQLQCHLPDNNGITLKIGKAARVVLPKLIRDRMGFVQGGDVELFETAAGLILKNASPKSSLIRKDDFLVHTGSLPASFDWSRLIDDERSDRDRRLLGL